MSRTDTPARDLYAHVTDERTRKAMNADPKTLDPALIRKLAEEALNCAEIDMDDPDVVDADRRLSIAEEAFDLAETDPLAAHRMLQRFWS